MRHIANKIIRNSTFNVIKGMVMFLIFLIITPFMIHKLGINGFGVWAMVRVLSSYVLLADIGISSALVKFVAEYHVRKDYKKINELFSTSFIVYLLVSVVIVVILMVIKDLIITSFIGVKGLFDEIDYLITFSFFVFAINLIFSTYVSLLTGFQRIDIINKISIGTSIIEGVGIFIVLSAGLGLRGLVLPLLAGSLFSVLLSPFAVKKLYPQIKIFPTHFDFSDIKELLGFGLYLQASVFASFFHFHFDKILLSYYLGVGAVAYYEIASRLAYFMRRLPEYLISPIFPAASELFAKKSQKTLTVLYSRSSKYIIIFCLPLFVFFVFMAQRVIFLWVGDGYHLSAITLQFLLVAFFCNVLTGPGFNILNGIGKPRYGMESSVLALVLNFVLSLILVIKIGYMGVVYGTFISMLIAALYFHFRFYYVTSISIINPSRNILLFTLTMSICLSYISHIFLLLLPQSILSLGLVGGAYVVLIEYVLLKSGYIDQFDKELILKYFPLGKRIIK
ncbi:MAG: flippase [Candidatus Saganbacteria bacterium]|nr:flippase [Candidatus Saganbacteria bacterium]